MKSYSKEAAVAVTSEGIEIVLLWRRESWNIVGAGEESYSVAYLVKQSPSFIGFATSGSAEDRMANELSKIGFSVGQSSTPLQAFPSAGAKLFDQLEKKRILGTDYEGDMPPDGWIRNKEPSNPHPIDREITAFVKRNKKPMFVFEDDDCPYWSGRSACNLARKAARDASALEEIRSTLRRENLKAISSAQKLAQRVQRDVARLEDLSGKLNTAIHLAQLSTKSALQRNVVLRGEFPKRSINLHVLNYVDLDQSICKLQQLLRDGRMLLGPPRFDIQRAQFALFIADWYEHHTGSKAAAGDGPFVRILAAAWDTVFPDEKHMTDWHHLVRSLKKVF